MRANRFLALAAVLVTATATRAEIIYGLTDVGTGATGSLVFFDSANPAAFTPVGPVTGLTVGQQLRGIDFRPATGELYGLSSVTGGSDAQLYTLNLTTGAATPVGAAFTLTGNTSSRISLDFNPVVDLLRVVTGSDQNFRINPTTGLATQDTNISPAGNLVSGVAYTNNVAGAASTTLYAVDFALDTLYTVGSPSPNDGTLNTVGGFGGPTQFNAATGFDISGATGVAYLSMDESASPTANAELYTVDLATGAVSLVAEEINNLPLLDLSVFVAPVPEPATVGLVGVLGLGLSRVVRRRFIGR